MRHHLTHGRGRNTVGCSTLRFHFSKTMLSTTTVPFSIVHLSQCTPTVMDVNFFRTSRLRSRGIAHWGWLKESSLSLYVLKPGETRKDANGYPDSRLAP